MELEILKDIVVIFALSTFVNFVFSKLRIPTIVGYLLTGVLAGPHIFSLIHSEHEIELMAEIGIVLLLFTIGMEFSLKHLLKIRRIVFFGGFLQVSLTAAAFYFMATFYNLNWQSAIFIGFLASLSSSAIVLKILQERSEITSNYGRTVVGILIFQDILLVPMLLFTNFLGSNSMDITRELVLLAFKTAFIIGFVYVGNKWFFPWLLHKIALVKNQELFMMSVFLICLSTALLTSELGMSLAFGAFLAGLMISESEYSHNAFAQIITFKDTFTSFFFVSIGMLIDISFIYNNIQLILFTVAAIIFIKTFFAGATGFILGHTFRGTVIVGLALSQVGEFSFILAKIGLEASMLSEFYYQLFLAVAVITMGITPFSIKLAPSFASLILKIPLPKFLVNGLFPLKEIPIPNYKNHLVIIGKDTSALKLSKMATLNDLKHISIIFDPIIAKEKMQEGDTVLYGDAVNEPILLKAHVDTADIVVISVGNIIACLSITDKVKQLNKSAYIIVRTQRIANVEQIYAMGADQVIPEKLEIAIDLFQRILLKKLYPQKQVNRIVSHIRSMSLGDFMEKDIVNQPSVLDEFPNLNIVALKADKGAFTEGKSIAEIRLRQKTGGILLAIKRDSEIIEHPEANEVIKESDIVYVLGNPEQINSAVELFRNSL